MCKCVCEILMPMKSFPNTCCRHLEAQEVSGFGSSSIVNYLETLRLSTPVDAVARNRNHVGHIRRCRVAVRADAT